MPDSSKTKILMLGWEFPPYTTGGLGFACLGLAQALSSNENVEVTFVLPRKIDVSHPTITFRFANIPDVESETFGKNTSGVYMSSREYDIRLNEGAPLLFGSSILEEVKLYAQYIRKIAAEEDFDVIHAHDWLSMLAGVEAKKVSGKPLIVQIHATSFDQAAGDNVNPVNYAIEKYGMEMADLVIAVSGYTKDLIVKKYGIDPDKIRVVHNGVPDRTLPDGEDTGEILAFKEAGYHIVLCYGRVTIQKGVDYFIKAAARVLEYEPKTVFIVAGTGEMEHQLMQQAAALGISDRVLFTNKFMEGAERLCLLRSADVYAMPSVSEPFGIIPLEVLLEGHTPVIISKQSGVKEVLKHALQVDFWDTDELANKIVSVLRNKTLGNQLSDYGRKEAAGVTWEKASAKCLSIYQEIISHFKSKIT